MLRIIFHKIIKYSMLLPTDKRDRTKKNKKTMELKIKGSPSDFEQMIEKQLKDDFEVQ